MYERDGFVYGDEAATPRVIHVDPLPDYELFLIFDNGEKRVFDAKPLLEKQPFKPLLTKKFFDNVRVSFGTIAWDNNIDYSPDTLYAKSKKIDEMKEVAL